MEHMFAGRFSRHTGFLQKTVTCILLASFLLHLFQPVLLHAQDRSINDYLLPDEHVVTLAPGLDYNGRLYEIHYFTNGSLNDNKARLIGLATPESFTQQQISGLLVTADGEIVDDEETMREVFLLYRSAYFLYDVAASGPLGFTDFYPFEDFRSDLRKITANPIFIEQQIKGLFSSLEEENAEALRGIITPQVETPTILQDFGSGLKEGLNQDVSFFKTVDLTLEATQYANNETVQSTALGVKEMLSSLIKKPGANFEFGGKAINAANVLHLLDLAVRLAWIADLQEERANWLDQYTSFTAGDTGLTSEQNTAASQVIGESKSSIRQRGEIILDFAQDRTVSLGVNMAKKEFFRTWMTWGAQESTNRLASFLVASAGTVTLAITLGNFLYGLDDLYNNFVVAERSDELREKFYENRIHLQEQVRFSPIYYDAEIARQFRITYMLENLATAQAFRSYSDGVEGTLNGGILGFLNPINWLKGKEWKEAIVGLRNEADSLEVEIDEILGHPEFIDTAVDLVWLRLAGLSSPLGTCDINTNDSIDIHEQEIDGSNIYVVCIDLTDPHIRLQTVMANDVLNVNAVPDQRETVQNMVTRSAYEPHHPIVALNADYFGTGHGAEGLTVIKGDRIDGPNNGDCDNTDFADCHDNAIFRPSLAVSRLNDLEITIKDASEVTNDILQLSRFYNSVGGGPTLVTNGRLIPDPCPPEGFSNSHECRQIEQTAVGVTQDGSTFIVIVADKKTGLEMGQLLLQHGAHWGMKLDGSDSSQLWYRGESKMKGGGVANAMLIFREDNPRHETTILEQPQFPVVQAGEQFTVTMRLANTGFLPWDAQLDYALQHIDGESFSIPSPRFLPATVDTGYDLEITLEGLAPDTPGFHQSAWQLIYQDSHGFIEPVSDEIDFLVTVVPEGTSPDIIDSMQQLIDELRAGATDSINDYLDQIKQAIMDNIKAELLKLIPPELHCLLGLGVILSNGWFLTFWRRGKKQDD